MTITPVRSDTHPNAYHPPGLPGSAFREASDGLGAIRISPRVAFTLALHAALSTYGVVGIASRYTGFDCTHTEPRRGLAIKITEGAPDLQVHVDIDIHIIAEYGVRIQSVTGSLQHQIAYGIERSTGYAVDAVNVHVSSLRVTNAD